MLRDCALVFLGAGAGGVCRWLVGVACVSLCGPTRFPAATLLANLAACALAGAFAGIFARGGDDFARLLLVVGFCGGMSTLSAFGLETVVLLRRGDFFVAGTNVLVTLCGCCALIWLLLRKFENFS